MINAMTAYNMSEKARKDKEDVWLQIENRIVKQANFGNHLCEYEVYPDSSVSVEDIVSKLKDLGFKVRVEEYNEAELDFEQEYCYSVIIEW